MRRLSAFLLAVGLLAWLASPPGLGQSVTAQQEYKQARVLASAGRWQEALGLLERALKADPDDPDCLYLASLCHLSLQQYDQAELRLKRLTGLRADFYPAWSRLAWMYVQQKKLDQARETLGALGKVKGGAPEAHYGFGVLAWIEGRLDVAETEWREALRLKPDMARAHHNLGLLYREKADRARALGALQDAVRLDAENSLYRLSLGQLQLEMGVTVDGMANLDRVRSQTERPDLALLALAAQMLQTGHPTQAERAAAQAFAANAELTGALVLRARALEALQRPAEARALFEQALADDPNIREAREALVRLPRPEPPASPSPTPEASPEPPAGPSPTPEASPEPPASPSPTPAP